MVCSVWKHTAGAFTYRLRVASVVDNRKAVIANQMKTVIGEVQETDWETESGEKIDVVFGAKSMGDRIVSSPYIIGTTTTLLDVIGTQAVAIYRKK